MDLQQDFKEPLARFDKRGVEFLAVGGYAVAFHGAPRHTGGLGLFVNPAPNKAIRIVRALRELGFGGIGLGENDFSIPGKAVRPGVPPVRVDIAASVDGVHWIDA